MREQRIVLQAFLRLIFCIISPLVLQITTHLKQY
jgi:hypothetical protein